MPSSVRVCLACLLLCCLGGSSAWRRDLTHDLYIWQRQWTPGVAAAVRDTADLARAWRVLAAHTDGQGRLRAMAVDWPVLAASGRPSIAVIRVGRRIAPIDGPLLLAEIDGLLAGWREAGLRLAGLEIDHDCGTARLADYARFLSALRDRLREQGVALSITALPTWLGAAPFDAVRAAVDEIVLQVHSVQDPRGLFDADLAGHWIDLLAQRGDTPFRVALPAYGVRLAMDDRGRVVGVRGEAPILSGGDRFSEAMAAPAEVAMLLRRLERSPNQRFRGIAWFRLPVEDDTRSWSAGTLRAVIRGAPIDAEAAVALRPTATPGLRHVVLVNAGPIDAALPRAVALPAGCAAGDGANGYALDPDGTGLVLRGGESGALRGGRVRVIGWARCDGGGEARHARR